MRKILVLTLSLAIFMASTVVAMAGGHTHSWFNDYDWTPGTDYAGITCTCSNPDCPIGSISFLFKAPEDLNYDGNEKHYTIENGEEFKAVTGVLTNGDPNIYYSPTKNGTQTKVSEIRDAGYYSIRSGFLNMLVMRDFEIEPAAVTLLESPTATDLTVGQTLADSTLSGGIITGVNKETVSGTFSWKYPDTAPEYSGDQIAVFTPDTVNYSPVEITVPVVVDNSFKEFAAKVDGKDAKVGEPGHKEYYANKELNKYFEDKECTREIPDIKAWLAKGGAGYIAPLAEPEIIEPNVEKTDKTKDTVSVDKKKVVNEEESMETVDTPKTGDPSHTLLPLMIISFAITTILTAYRRRID